MTRKQLEHILRAGAAIAQVDTIVVVGSQSILGAHPDAPASLLRSDEADVLVPNHPELAELIEGAIGEGSAFHDTFGYYAQAVDERTSILPNDWNARLIEVRNANTGWATGLCLDPSDLIVAKLIAGREKDVRFAHDAVAAGLVAPTQLFERLAVTVVSEDVRERTRARIAALTAT